jgi:hypothetical protein
MNTRCPQEPDIRLIPLTQGKFAIVDADDYDWLSQYKWYAVKDSGTFYAGRKSKGRLLLMHREILQPPKDAICDHINHNGLDNRRSNVRVCTRAQNQHNRKPQPAKSSKYKGVNWYRTSNKWQVGIRFNSKRMHLGYFDDEMEAALAYDRRAAVLFGEFACLNFPQLIEFRKWLKKII